MKVIRQENGKFLDVNSGRQVTWHDIHQHTGLPRSQARLVLKHLSARGVEVPPEKLLRWRDDQVLIWKLETEYGVTLPEGL